MKFFPLNRSSATALSQPWYPRTNAEDKRCNSQPYLLERRPVGVCVPSLRNLFRAIFFDLVAFVICLLAASENRSASTSDRTKAPKPWDLHFFEAFLDSCSVISKPRVKCYRSPSIPNICSHATYRNLYIHCDTSYITAQFGTMPALPVHAYHSSYNIAVDMHKPSVSLSNRCCAMLKSPRDGWR